MSCKAEWPDRSTGHDVPRRGMAAAFPAMTGLMQFTDFQRDGSDLDMPKFAGLNPLQNNVNNLNVPYRGNVTALEISVSPTSCN